MSFSDDAGAAGAALAEADEGPAVPVQAHTVPDFDRMFELVTPHGSKVPLQLGRGSFGAVFVGCLRPEAAPIIASFPAEARIFSEEARSLLLHPGLQFACKFVMLADSEAAKVFEKEVQAATAFSRHIESPAGRMWRPLAQATLTTTLYGWSDTLLEADTGEPVLAMRSKPGPAGADTEPAGSWAPARLVRTVMELSHAKAAKGVFLGEMGDFVLPAGRITLPRLRRATDDEMDGSSDLCESNFKTLAQIKSVIVQLLLALHTLHSNRRVHRDVKPDNILEWRNAKGVPAPVHMEPWVKLTDYGMMRVQAEGERDLTQDVGTKAYNPPELYTSAGHPVEDRIVLAYDGSKMDVFSAGCTLYNLLGGGKPGGAATVGFPHRFDFKKWQTTRRALVLKLDAASRAAAEALVGRMCQAAPAARCTALEALQDAFFDDVVVPAALWPPNMPVPAAAAAAGGHGIRPDGPVPAMAAAAAAAPAAAAAAAALGGAGGPDAGGAVAGAGAAP